MVLLLVVQLLLICTTASVFRQGNAGGIRSGVLMEDIPALVFIATKQALIPYEFMGQFLQPLAGEPQWDIQALSIAVDIRGEMIYWISATDNLIYRQNVTADYSEPAQEEVITCCLETPENLAVDWLGRNLYWTDSTRGTIEVAKLDGMGRTVLAENLDHPTLIALDPLRGDLYWAPKRNVEIYRMKMSGNESSNELFWRTHRIENTEGSIFGMAVNYIGEADILYWGIIYDSDEGLFIMESDLNNPNILQTLTYVPEIVGTPFHIQTLQEGTVFYHIDEGLKRIVDHIGNVVLFDGAPEMFEDFHIAHHSLQPGVHECSISNGGCFGTETLCLVQDQYRGLCECPAWTARQVQQTTEGEIHQICLSLDTFVLIATSSDVHFLPVPPANSAVERGPPRPLPVGLFHNISAISYNPINDSILWVDSAKVLRSVTVNASLSSDVLSLSSSAPTSLAYDWVDGHVFVTEKGRFQTVNGEGRGSDIQSPSDVVFDVDSSMLYWVDHGRRIKFLSLEDITRSPQTLPLDGCRLIRQLSYAADHLFWINSDTQSSVISISDFSIADQSESVMLITGQDITVLTAAAVSGQPYVFWYNTSDRSIYFNNGATLEVFVQWTAPEDIVAFAGFERPASIPPDIVKSPTDLTVIQPEDAVQISAVQIGFVETAITVGEGAGLAVLNVALLIGTLEREVSVDVTTLDGTAVAPADYITTIQCLTFGPSSVLNDPVPVFINVTNNDQQEFNETFSASLTLVPTCLTVDLMPSVAVVTIEDHDLLLFTFEHQIYIFSEDSGFGIVCVNKTGDTTQTVDIMIQGDLQPGLGTINQILTFAPTDIQICVSCPIQDHNIGLEPPENLTFIITMNSSVSGIEINPYNTTIVVIVDEDGLTATIIAVTTTCAVITMVIITIACIIKHRWNNKPRAYMEEVDVNFHPVDVSRSFSVSASITTELCNLDFEDKHCDSSTFEQVEEGISKKSPPCSIRVSEMKFRNGLANQVDAIEDTDKEISSDENNHNESDEIGCLQNNNQAYNQIQHYEHAGSCNYDPAQRYELAGSAYDQIQSYEQVGIDYNQIPGYEPTVSPSGDACIDSNDTGSPSISASSANGYKHTSIDANENAYREIKSKEQTESDADTRRVITNSHSHRKDSDSCEQVQSHEQASSRDAYDQIQNSDSFYAYIQSYQQPQSVYDVIQDYSQVPYYEQTSNPYEQTRDYETVCAYESFHGQSVGGDAV